MPGALLSEGRWRRKGVEDGGAMEELGFDSKGTEKQLRVLNKGMSTHIMF